MIIAKLKNFKVNGFSPSLFVLFVFIQFNFATTPIINAVSTNQLAQGGQITITGSHLQDTDLSGLELGQSQSSFEGADFKTDGWEENRNWGDPDKNTMDASMAILGNKSYRNHIYNCGLENNGGFRCGSDLWEFRTVTFDTIFFRYYVRYSKNFEWPDNFLKQFYVHDAGFVFQPIVGGGAYVVAQPDQHIFNFVKPLQEERWHCLEGRFHMNGAEGEAWLDGQSLGKGTPGPMYIAGRKWTNFNIGTVNASTWWTQPNSNIWFDGINVSATRRIRPEALVCLANGTNLSTATKVNQELIHISDNSIQFKVNTAGLGTGPIYAFVINNRNETSPAFSAGSAPAWDLVAPVVSGLTPDSNKTNIAANVIIRLTITDPAPASGVNDANLVMKINGQVVTPTLSGINPVRQLQYRPATPFPAGSTVTVNVSAKDLEGNARNLTYSFQIAGTAGIQDDEGFVGRGIRENSQQFTVNSRNGSVKFILPEAGQYQLSVYDLAGREVGKARGAGKEARGEIEKRAELKNGLYMAILKQNGMRVSKTFCVIK